MSITARELEEIQKIIGYRFKDLALLGRAFTHTSYANEKKLKKSESNERLEFLGDGVVGVITSRYLFEKYKEEDEGFLTRVKSFAVSRPTLANAAVKLNLGKYLLLGRGEDAASGREKDSALSNVFEAVAGAMYLDGGIEPVREYVKKAVLLELVVDEREAKDYKSELQELIQKEHKKRPSYVVVSETGPEHKKVFLVRANFGGTVLGEGYGKSKKEAELEAAKVALLAINDNKINIEKL